MTSQIETFDDLLAHWTTMELRDDLGVPYVTARKMRERKSVAVEHWPSLVRSAASRGIKLKYEDLVAMVRAGSSRQSSGRAA